MLKKILLLTVFGFCFLQTVPAQQFTSFLTLGSLIEGEHDKYNLVTNAYAIEEDNTTQIKNNPIQNRQDQTIQIQNSPPSRSILLLQKGNFNFFLEPDFGSPTPPPANSVSVVLNQRTQNLGILTGTIIIKMKNLQEADSLIEDYNLTETLRFDGLLSLVIVKTEISQLNDLLEQIKSDSRIIRATPKILEYIFTPQ